MKHTLHTSWQKVLNTYCATGKFKRLMQKIDACYLDHTQTIYPPQSNIFYAFNKTPLTDIKVVILGQDPYHGAGQAHGLAFSVPSDVPAPPSLKNIFKEIDSDIYDQQGRTLLVNTDLIRWAKQGVFLLNSVLTVEAGKPASHANIGWEEFTDHVISTISESQEHVVFMLWGSYAQGKKQLIDTKKHLVLEAPHPSPLSAHRGFFGCKHFSKANNFLKKNNRQEIIWQ